jgi:hypothetical protein
MKARRNDSLLQTQGGFLMNMERRNGLPVVAALLLTSMSLTAQTTAPKKIKLLTLLGQPVQFVIAEKQGYFAKHGVSAETENLPSSDVLRSNLANGNGDLAYLAVDNAVTRTWSSSWAAKVRRMSWWCSRKLNRSKNSAAKR